MFTVPPAIAPLNMTIVVRKAKHLGATRFSQPLDVSFTRDASLQGKNTMSFFSEFSLTDRESCEKAIYDGGIAALVSAAFTTFLGIVMDRSFLVDAALISVLAVLVFRKSRVASTLLLVYFVASMCVMWAKAGKPTGLAFAPMFFMYYFTAMRAAFQLHSEYRAEVAVEAMGEEAI